MSGLEDGFFGESQGLSGALGTQELDQLAIAPSVVTEAGLETADQGLTQIEVDELFDPEYYLAKNPDLAWAGLTTPEELYSHWQNFGQEEGRDCSVLVDLDYYAAENPDIGAAGFTSSV
jgi:hypothetical protein